MSSSLIALIVLLPLFGILLINLSVPFLKKHVCWLTLFFPSLSLWCIWKLAQSSFSEHLISHPWAPSLGIHLSFIIDPLSLFFGSIITGVGVLVCLYSFSYFSKLTPQNYGRFYSYFLLFMASMLGAVFSNNFIILFIFWELTSVASFFLIGFTYETKEARRSAKIGFLVTLITGLVMFIGIVMLGLSYGTYEISEILTQAPPSGIYGVIAFIFILIGIMGKSAQFPFHFWLPIAMVAPTPVSTYLHSAAMVKLGIFLLARIAPLFAVLSIWGPSLLIIGLITMVFGALVAVFSHKLKEILAYTTISQLGFLVAAYAIETTFNLSHQLIHILTHVLYKGSLFMIAGVLISAYGKKDIRDLSGVFRRFPLTGLACLFTIAAMAGLPGTLGFVSKEIILSSVIDHLAINAWYWLVLAAYAITSIAFVCIFFRFVINLIIHNKTQHTPVKKVSFLFQLPFLVLSSAILLFGLFPSILQTIFSRNIHLYSQDHFYIFFHKLSAEFVYFTITFALGFSFYLLLKKWNWELAAPKWLQLDIYYDQIQASIFSFLDKINHFIRVDKPIDYPYIILSFILILGGYSMIPLISNSLFSTALLDIHNLSLLRIVVCVFIAVFAFGVIFVSHWAGRLISLSLVGFLVSFLFMKYKAPDLALTQMLIESATLILFLLLLGRFPRTTLESKSGYSIKHMISIAIAILSGLFIFCLLLISMNPSLFEPIGGYFIQNTFELAGGHNAVNTILVDFRGLDTLGEVSVLIIALLGILSLLKNQGRGANISKRISLKKSGASPILLAVSPYVVIFINVLAIYLFFRGHNHPGGGFIAGVASSLSFAILILIFDVRVIKEKLRIDPIVLAIFGLIVIYGIALAPLFWGDVFLTHKMAAIHLPLLGDLHIGTPMIFDLGVYLVVVGVITKIIIIFTSFTKNRVTFID